jgi:hypothetical protein
MKASRLFDLLLWSELVGVTALSLSAVRGTRRKTSVADTADGLLAVVLGSKSLQRWLNDTTTETEDQVESGLLLNVVVGKGSAIFKLLTSEDQSLLVRRNALLVLDLGLNVVDSIGRLNLEGDGLAGQSLDENLHFVRCRCFVVT